MKSDVELAIQWSKRFEKLLATKFNALGKGLHERIDRAQAELPDDIQSKLRVVATIRNKLVHDDAYSGIEDRAGFERLCSDIFAYLGDAVNATNPDGEATCLARLLHHFHVQYLKKGVPHVLRSGQIIPVWDLGKWSRVDEFEFHCSSAVRWNNLLIAGPGFDHPQEDDVTQAALVSKHRDRPEARERAIISQLACVPLGNVGGCRVLRPDPLPVGLVPMEARWSYGKPTWEMHSMSMLDWAKEVEGMSVVDRPLPEFRFFVESKEGEFEGFDIRRGKARIVTPIELPFSICSGEELDILTGDGDSLEREMAMLLSITQGVRRLVDAYGYRGQIYFGFDLRPGSEGVSGGDTDVMTVDDFLLNRGKVEIVYEIPFLGDNPFDVLNAAPHKAIRTLLRRPQAARRPRHSSRHRAK